MTTLTQIRERLAAAKSWQGVRAIWLTCHAEDDLTWACDRIKELERALKIAELKNATSLANNLCPDHRDKQKGNACLACRIETLERENAALRTHVSKSVVRRVVAQVNSRGETPPLPLSDKVTDAMRTNR